MADERLKDQNTKPRSTSPLEGDEAMFTVSKPTPAQKAAFERFVKEAKRAKHS